MMIENWLQRQTYPLMKMRGRIEKLLDFGQSSHELALPLCSSRVPAVLCWSKEDFYIHSEDDRSGMEQIIPPSQVVLNFTVLNLAVHKKY